MKPLPAERLRRRCDPERLRFATTAALEVERETLGQGRARCGRPRAGHRVVRQAELTESLLRELVAAARPVLVLPEKL